MSDDRIIRSIDEPLRPEQLVRRIRLPDGSEVELPMSDADRRLAWERLFSPDA